MKFWEVLRKFNLELLHSPLEIPPEVPLRIAPRIFSKIHRDIPRVILPGVLPRNCLKKVFLGFFSEISPRFALEIPQNFFRRIPERILDGIL